MMEIEIKTEIEELFHAVMENFKSEESNTVDTKPTIQSGDYKFQIPYDGTEYSAAVTQSSKDIPLRSLCRLCTIPDNNMVDIFGFDATSKNILSMINHCLPVMVKETDSLPKQVCHSCLEELERCYRFHRTVAEAEKQLLAFGRLPSGNLERMQRNFETFSRGDEEDGSTTYDNIDETLKTISDTEMRDNSTMISPERAASVDATVMKTALLSSLRPCSVVLSIVEIERMNDPEINSNKESLSNSRGQNRNSTTEAIHSETTPASGIVQQSTDHSKLTKRTRSRSVVNATQGKEAKHVSTKKVHPPIHERSRGQERCYTCNTCAKVYQTKASLYKHYRLHTGKGLHICEYCGKKFLSKANAIRHNRTHTGERPFECSMCQKRYPLLPTLTRHKATVHSAKRDYPCSLCDKSFKTLQYRKRHMLVHTDENKRRLWQCDYCKRSYMHKNHLMRHINSCKDQYRSKNVISVS